MILALFCWPQNALSRILNIKFVPGPDNEPIYAGASPPNLIIRSKQPSEHTGWIFKKDNLDGKPVYRISSALEPKNMVLAPDEDKDYALGLCEDSRKTRWSICRVTGNKVLLRTGTVCLAYHDSKFHLDNCDKTKTEQHIALENADTLKPPRFRSKKRCKGAKLLIKRIPESFDDSGDNTSEDDSSVGSGSDGQATDADGKPRSKSPRKKKKRLTPKRKKKAYSDDSADNTDDDSSANGTPGQTTDSEKEPSRKSRSKSKKGNKVKEKDKFGTSEDYKKLLCDSDEDLPVGNNFKMKKFKYKKRPKKIFLEKVEYVTSTDVKTITVTSVIPGANEPALQVITTTVTNTQEIEQNLKQISTVTDLNVIVQTLEVLRPVAVRIPEESSSPAADQRDDVIRIGDYPYVPAFEDSKKSASPGKSHHKNYEDTAPKKKERQGKSPEISPGVVLENSVIGKSLLRPAKDPSPKRTRHDKDSDRISKSHTEESSETSDGFSAVNDDRRDKCKDPPEAPKNEYSKLLNAIKKFITPEKFKSKENRSEEHNCAPYNDVLDRNLSDEIDRIENDQTPKKLIRRFTNAMKQSPLKLPKNLAKMCQEYLCAPKHKKKQYRIKIRKPKPIFFAKPPSDTKKFVMIPNRNSEIYSEKKVILTPSGYHPHRSGLPKHSQPPRVAIHNSGQQICEPSSETDKITQFEPLIHVNLQNNNCEDISANTVLKYPAPFTEYCSE